MKMYSFYRSLCSSSKWFVSKNCMLSSKNLSAAGKGLQYCIKLAQETGDVDAEQTCLQVIFNNDFFWTWNYSIKRFHRFFQVHILEVTHHDFSFAECGVESSAQRLLKRPLFRHSKIQRKKNEKTFSNFRLGLHSVADERRPKCLRTLTTGN